MGTVKIYSADLTFVKKTFAGCSHTRTTPLPACFAAHPVTPISRVFPKENAAALVCAFLTFPSAIRGENSMSIKLQIAPLEFAYTPTAHAHFMSIAAAFIIVEKKILEK